MKKYELSHHAKEQLETRNIPEERVWEVINNPQQITEGNEEEDVFQSILNEGNKQKFLLRIFINTAKNLNLIITVYKTSKIEKYRANEGLPATLAPAGQAG